MIKRVKLGRNAVEISRKSIEGKFIVERVKLGRNEVEISRGNMRKLSP